MYKIAMVFHPESFVGFNKTQLIERHLLSSGFIGSRFRASSSYTAGAAYRQFIPKQETIQRYNYGIIRIHIQAIGQWLSSEQAKVMDHANLVVVEGDVFIDSKAKCLKFCNFLKQITGDTYNVDRVPEIGCLGIREQRLVYFSDKNIVNLL